MTTQVSGDTGVSQCQSNSVSQDDLQGNIAGKGPAFSAFNSASQNGYTNGVTVVTNSERYDTNGFHSNGVFAPTIPGYYFVSMSAYLRASSGSPTFAQGRMVRTGGSGTLNINGPSSASFSTTDAMCFASGLVFMNGIDDTLTSSVLFSGSQVSPRIEAGAAFEGVLVRAA